MPEERDSKKKAQCYFAFIEFDLKISQLVSFVARVLVLFSLRTSDIRKSKRKSNDICVTSRKRKEDELCFSVSTPTQDQINQHPFSLEATTFMNFSFSFLIIINRQFQYLHSVCELAELCKHLAHVSVSKRVENWIGNKQNKKIGNGIYSNG